MTIFFIFVGVLSFVFLLLNFLFAPHNPYQEKYSIFECGFHNFLGQNRTQFEILFFVFAILFLILDLELFGAYPFAVSLYENSLYGFIIAIIFIIIVTIGFIFEIGKGALSIETKQNLFNDVRSF